VADQGGGAASHVHDRHLEREGLKGCDSLMPLDCIRLLLLLLLLFIMNFDIQLLLLS
jgi:hypothetical protein